MPILFFLLLLLFVIIVQVMIPYLIKKTVVFGVTVPDQFVHHEKLALYKKRYTWITAVFSLVITMFSVFFLLKDNLSELAQVIITIGAVYLVIVTSIVLYFFFHIKVSKLKSEEEWLTNLRQVRVVDVTVRQREEMVPWPFLLIPMLLSFVLMGYTLMHYEQLPDLIPTHWGSSGAADNWVEKTPLTAIIMPLVLLMMQWMMAGIVDAMKHSGIKVSVNQKEKSIERQLEIRKFTSWYITVLTYALTLALTVIQLTLVHEQFAKASILLPFFIGILVVSLGGSLLFMWKLHKVKLAYPKKIDSELMDVDEDQYWKGGLIYFNPNDPSVFVEKRFGVGWTMNLASVRGYIVIVLPLLLLLVLSISTL